MHKKGFTLIELLVAISLFMVIMVVSLGSITGIFDANRKSRSLNTVLNNLNLAMETMSKEMRYGTKYHCGDNAVEDPQNCPAGGTLMSFLSSDSVQITYRFASSSIEKKIGAGQFAAVTAPELILDNLTFYTLGAGTGNTLQPKVLIKLSGHAGATNKGRTDLSLQTLVSQRWLDEDEFVFVPPPPDPIISWNCTAGACGANNGTQAMSTGTLLPFTTTGTYNLTIDSIASLTFRGAAGGGKGQLSAPSNGDTCGTNGGGAGAVTNGTPVTLNTGKTYTLIVGAGGAGSFTDGSPTTFRNTTDNVTMVSLNGGSKSGPGGTVAPLVPPVSNGVDGGAGGAGGCIDGPAPIAGTNNINGAAGGGGGGGMWTDGFGDYRLSSGSNGGNGSGGAGSPGVGPGATWSGGGGKGGGASFPSAGGTYGWGCGGAGGGAGGSCGGAAAGSGVGLLYAN